MRGLLVIAAVAALASACASSPGAREAHDVQGVQVAFAGSEGVVTGPERTDVARVCVIRPSALVADTTLEVRDNGRLVGATRGKTYFCYLAAAGDHQIRSALDDTGPTVLHAAAGARYWLHQEMGALAEGVHAHLDWVDERTALELVDACEARVRVSVPGHDRSADAMAIAPAR